MVRRDRQEDPVDRLYRFFHDGIGADMPGCIGRFKRGIAEGKIDAFLRPRVTLDLHPDRRDRHVEEGASDADRHPRRDT